MSNETKRINLKKFQEEARDVLIGYMEDEKIHDIVLKSPTGSGKTVILTHLMNKYQNNHEGSGTVFVWLTPGAGELDGQSMNKMLKNFETERSHIKDFDRVMLEGFKAGDYCFINWEKVNKKDNVAWQSSEKGSLHKKIEKAINTDGLNFKLIIDESHRNKTPISSEIIGFFYPSKIIWASATPEEHGDAEWIISDEKVIREGLIKSMISINEGFQQDAEAKAEMDAEAETETAVDYLLKKGLEKQKWLHQLFLEKGLDINPLIVVQLPSESSESGSGLRKKVEDFFGKEDINITYGNKQLALNLADDKRNLEILEDGVVVQKIEDNNATPVAVIIKQAVATGWDCPRAYILVKFREHSSDRFDIQTIGRIRRMPEAKHYKDKFTDSDLNTCYIYTFDTKFVEGLQVAIGDEALNVLYLFLKQDVRIHLIKERWEEGSDSRDPQKALDAIVKYFKGKNLLLGGDENDNKGELRKLELGGESFFIPEKEDEEKIRRIVVSKRVRTFDELQGTIEKREKEEIYTELSADDADWELHSRIREIGKEISMHYYDTRTLLFRLFCREEGDKENRFLSLSVRSMYYFIINNATVLRRALREAMAEGVGAEQQSLPQNAFEEPFLLDAANKKLSSIKFTYNAAVVEEEEEQYGKGNAKVSTKNVYDGYLLSAARPRSGPELQFEEFCEGCPDVEWLYKNGDSGEDHFSIVYRDNWSRQRLFFPDYILSIKGKICIIETKGGFGKSGEDEDGDIVSQKKLNALKRYLKMHGLKGGIVRFDKSYEKPKPFIATEKYTDGKNDDAWKPLEDFIKSL